MDMEWDTRSVQYLSFGAPDSAEAERSSRVGQATFTRVQTRRIRDLVLTGFCCSENSRTGCGRISDQNNKNTRETDQSHSHG